MFNFFRTKKIAISVISDLSVGEAAKTVSVSKDFSKYNTNMLSAYADVENGEIVPNTVKVFEEHCNALKFSYQDEAFSSQNDYTNSVNRKGVYLEKNYFFTEAFQDKKSLLYLKVLEPFVGTMLRDVARKNGWFPSVNNFVVKTNVCDYGYILTIFSEGAEPFKRVDLRRDPNRNIKDLFMLHSIEEYINLFDFVKYYKDPDNFSYLAASVGIYDMVNDIAGTLTEDGFERSATKLSDAVDFFEGALSKSLY